MSDWFLSTLTPEQRAQVLENQRRYRDAARTMFDQLQERGHGVGQLSELEVAGPEAESVVGILWNCYKESDYVPLRLGILSTLGEKWAGDYSMPLLLSEFAEFVGPSDPGGIAFGVGDAIRRRARKQDLESLLALVHDQQRGIARSGVVSALASIRGHQSVESTLISLLNDPTVATTAAEELGRLKSVGSLPALLKCAQTHPNENARKAAKSAAVKIARRQAGVSSG